jgi:hypothetical protein
MLAEKYCRIPCLDAATEHGCEDDKYLGWVEWKILFALSPEEGRALEYKIFFSSC